jgi:hypothetical protein
VNTTFSHNSSSIFNSSAVYPHHVNRRAAAAAGSDKLEEEQSSSMQLRFDRQLPVFRQQQPGHSAAVLSAAGEQFSSSTAAIKLPEFWTADPEMWFWQEEYAFRRAQVTDSLTKYDHVLTKLPEAVISSIWDLVCVVDHSYTDANEQLKSCLLSSYGQSKWQQINKLLDHHDLRARRPSFLMDQMLTLLLAGEKHGLLFVSLFLRLLPIEYWEHLAAKNFSSPRAMAEYSDVLWDARGGDSQCVVAMFFPQQRAGRSHQQQQQSG